MASFNILSYLRRRHMQYTHVLSCANAGLSFQFAILHNVHQDIYKSRESNSKRVLNFRDLFVYHCNFLKANYYDLTSRMNILDVFYKIRSWKSIAGVDRESFGKYQRKSCQNSSYVIHR